MLGWGNEKSKNGIKRYFGKEKKLIGHEEEGDLKIPKYLLTPNLENGWGMVGWLLVTCTVSRARWPLASTRVFNFLERNWGSSSCLSFLIYKRERTNCPVNVLTITVLKGLWLLVSVISQGPQGSVTWNLKGVHCEEGVPGASLSSWEWDSLCPFLLSIW